MDVRWKVSKLLQLQELLPVGCSTPEAVWVKNTSTVFYCVSDDGW